MINKIKESIKLLLYPAIEKTTNLIPIKNVILFESFPAYSDNTRAVFDKMLEKNLNEKYKFIWVCYSKDEIDALKDKFSNKKNVFVTYKDDLKYKFYDRKRAKAFVVCNAFLNKPKDNQYYIDLAHGCALKNAAGKYSLPKFCDEVMTISNYIAKYDAHNFSCDVNKMVPLGYARNDDLFKKIDLHTVFSEYDFKKFIYWLPTYRQNKWGTNFHSDISMPILYTEKEARQLNECAKNNDVLVVVKVHPSQDLTKIDEFKLSNVIFIKNDFFIDKDYTNYQVLGSSDAMISDYSSVYYDYLLCDKPIGLCWDDFEEYNKREGFTLDPNYILKGGEKIYNIDDLCYFVTSIANDEDKLLNERNEIKNLVHDYIDDNSSNRIVDHILEKIEK